MKIVVHLAAYYAIFLLNSCAIQENVVVKEKDPQQQKIKRLAIKDGLFEAWNDFSIDDITLVNSVNISDRMIKYKQWGDAKSKLSQTLRMSPEYAPVWSRMAWLSLRSAQLNKAIRLAKRSNGHTDSKPLKKLNWSFMRDAYKLMGKTTELKHANQMIQQLNSGAR